MTNIIPAEPAMTLEASGKTMLIFAASGTISEASGTTPDISGKTKLISVAPETTSVALDTPETSAKISSSVLRK